MALARVRVRLGIGLGLGFRSGQSQCVPPFRSVNYHILVKAVLYRSVNSLGVLDRLIHGLTRTVLKPSDSLDRRLERAHRAACRKVVNRPNVVSGIDPDVVATKDAWYTQRRNYRELCRRKRCAFWCHTVESDRESPRRLWTSVNQQVTTRSRPATCEFWH